MPVRLQKCPDGKLRRCADHSQRHGKSLDRRRVPLRADDLHGTNGLTTNGSDVDLDMGLVSVGTGRAEAWRDDRQCGRGPAHVKARSSRAS